MGPRQHWINKILDVIWRRKEQININISNHSNTEFHDNVDGILIRKMKTNNNPGYCLFLNFVIMKYVIWPVFCSNDLKISHPQGDSFSRMWLIMIKTTQINKLKNAIATETWFVTFLLRQVYIKKKTTN